MFAKKYFTTTSVLTCTLQNDLSVEFDTRRLPLGGGGNLIKQNYSLNHTCLKEILKSEISMFGFQNFYNSNEIQRVQKSG